GGNHVGRVLAVASPKFPAKPPVGGAGTSQCVAGRRVPGGAPGRLADRPAAGCPRRAFPAAGFPDKGARL
ncbi:MAG TPA: hypothetical protein VFY53_11990, partial [Rhodoplanes sp.]|nr:hypothetical protein [Rhodoplanes sp.]